MNERLQADLLAASGELKVHMASWEYAFAMGSGRDGARNHPLHAATRARTDQLVTRCRDLRALIAEHEV